LTEEEICRIEARVVILQLAAGVDPPIELKIIQKWQLWLIRSWLT